MSHTLFDTAKEMFEAARLHEVAGRGCEATDTLKLAVERLVSILESGYGQESERRMWRQHAASCVEHLRQMQPVRKHIAGWIQAHDKADAVARAGADAERTYNNPQGAMQRYEAAAKAYLDIMKAVEASTGPSGRAGTAPWSWFAIDTQDLFAKCQRQVSALLSEFERLKPLAARQRAAQDALYGPGFSAGATARSGSGGAHSSMHPAAAGTTRGFRPAYMAGRDSPASWGSPSSSSSSSAAAAASSPPVPSAPPDPEAPPSPSPYPAAAATPMPPPSSGAVLPASSASSSPSSGGRALTANELAVLRFTSHIQGKVYLPWVPQDAAVRASPGKRFTDPDGLLGLSRAQKRHFARWARPHEVLVGGARACMIAGGRSPTAESVKQELVGTCSFLSSLCAAAEYERRTGERVISGSIYPQDRSGMPVLSPSGEYHVRLQLNGVWRCVVVDDVLPVDGSGRLLCSHSSVPGELWVSLFEKAFLKVLGSYAFPGSTSSKDLCVLTGWLPETLKATREGFDKDRVWRRVVGGHRYKDVLCTVATDEMSEAEEERLGLVSSHSYAVLAVADVDTGTGATVRMMKLKNPWGRKRFEGRYSFRNRSAWTPQVQRAVGVTSPASEAAKDNGVFWVTYDEVLAHFPSLYLSWKPSLLPHSSVWHAAWPLASPGPRKDRYTFQYNPQFRLRIYDASSTPAASGSASSSSALAPSKSSSRPLAWVLVTKHVVRIKPDEEDDAPGGEGDAAPYVPRGRASQPREGLLGEAAAEPGKTYMALHVYGDEARVDTDMSEVTPTSLASAAASSRAPPLEHAGSQSEEGSSSSSSSSSRVASAVCSSGARAGERVYFPLEGVIAPTVYSPAPYLLTKVALHPRSSPPSSSSAVASSASTPLSSSSSPALGASSPPPTDLTLVLSQLERVADVHYTVKVFCTHPIALTPVPDTFPHHSALFSAAWAPGLDGGRAGSKEYFSNPQACMTTTRAQDVQLYLHGPAAHSIGLRVFDTDGTRVTSWAAKEVAGTHVYRRSFNCITIRQLPAGTYTILMATFDSGVHSKLEMIASGSVSSPVLTMIA